MKNFVTAIIFACLLGFLGCSSPALAMRITSLDRTSAKGGETITIRGSDLKSEGTESCTYYPPGSKTIVWSTCHFKTTVVAMKKEPADGCPRPITFLPIVSVTSTEAVVKIPASMQDGEGQWYISWSGKYDNGDEFLVGSGDLPLMITGVQSSKYTCVQKDGTVIGTPKQPTVTPSLTPSPSPSPAPTVEPTNPAPSPIPNEKNQPADSFLLRIITAPYHWLLKLIRMS